MTSSRWSGHESCRSCSPKAGERVDLYVEYFDFVRFPRPEYESAYLDFLRLKYAEKRFDLIIVIGEVAINFMSRNQNVLFRGTPAVFLFAHLLGQPTRQFDRSDKPTPLQPFARPRSGAAARSQTCLRRERSGCVGPEEREPGKSGVPPLRGTRRIHVFLGPGDAGSRKATQNAAATLGGVLPGREPGRRGRALSGDGLPLPRRVGGQRADVQLGGCRR